MKRILVVAGVLAVLSLTHAVRAETVILADGSRIEGQVQVAGGQVSITTQGATLTLPASRVIGLERAAAAAAPVAPLAPAAPKVAAPPAASVVPAAAPVSGPPPLGQALAMRTVVAFDGASPDEAFGYLRQITGMNLVLSNDVRRDATPVYMRLHDVTVATVLNMLADMNGYAYEQKPGEILFAGMKSAGTGYVMRVYQVRDLLVSTEDLGSSLSGTNGGQSNGGGNANLGRSNTSGANRSQGPSPQFAAPSSGSATISGAGTSSITGAAVPDGLLSRAQDLALLIIQTCGH